MQKSSIKETLSTLVLDRKLSKIEYRNVWTVRVVALIIVFLTLDINDNFISENLPRKNRDWAAQWIATNDLNSPSIIMEEGSKPQFASLNPTEKVIVSNTELTKALSAINNVASVTETNTKSKFKVIVTKGIESNQVGQVIETNTIIDLTLESNQNSLAFAEFTKTPDVVELSTTINYERQLEYNYWMAAQNNVLKNQKAASNTQWMARGTIGPQFAQGSISQPSGNTYANASNINNMVTDAEGVSANKSNNAFSAMLNVGMSVGSNMQLLSGINFSQIDGAHSAYYDSEVLKSQNIITTSVNTAENGIKTTDLIEEDVQYTNYFSDTLQANYRVTSVEIPLVLKYNFGKNKLSYFLSSGVSANLGSSYSAHYQSNEIGSGAISESKYGVNSVNLLLGLGMEYQASPKITIQLSPGYKYGIPISNSSMFNSPVSTLGLFTGLSYYFD